MDGAATPECCAPYGCCTLPIVARIQYNPAIAFPDVTASQVLHFVPSDREKSQSERISLLLAVFAQFIFPRCCVAFGVPRQDCERVQKRTSRSCRIRTWKLSLHLRALVQCEGHLHSEFTVPLRHLSAITPITMASLSMCISKIAANRCCTYALPLTSWGVQS